MHYAVKLFNEIPLGVTDDFYASTGALELLINALIFEPRAKSYKARLLGSVQSEYKRKVRVITRAV